MPTLATAPTAPIEPARARGVLGRVLDLFSSVWFGIWLLVALFVYSSIGSAGIVYPEGWNIFSAEAWAHDQIRQWRGLEMTEFEWFHWWPFDLMMILIAANIAVTTVRRIPFKPVNYGVWMIHTGILLLIVGSFVYFGLKVEGDAPVARRRVVAQIGDVRADLVASPGQRIEFGEGANRTSLEVRAIDPAWEILTGDEKGTRAYSVTVLVERSGARFLRQLIDGRPQLTEDLIFTKDTKQPVKRAVKELGDPIFDKELSLSLDYEPQRWFYLRNDLVKSWALYVRPKGSTQWTERPIEGLPLYNDYIRSRDDVFQQGGDVLLPIDPLDLAVGPASSDDPLKDVEFRVHGYLRYAIPRSRLTDGGPNAPLNPIALLEVAGDDGKRSPPYRLIALDPQASRADQGVLRFVHLGEERELDRFLRQPTLTVRIPLKGIEVRDEIRDITAVNADAPFIEIKGSESDGKASYAYRVVNVQDELPIAGSRVSLAIVELRTPKGVFRRWVFDNPALTRDVKEMDAADAHGAPKFEDESVEVAFEPGNGLALVVLAHGPEEGRLRVVSAVSGKSEVIDAAVDKPVAIGGGVRLLIDDLLPRGIFETKPMVIRREERLRDAMELFSQIKLVLPGGQSLWVPFSSYAFDESADAIRRAPFEPQTVKLADGREIEVLFSRQRLPLGTEVALEEFVLTAHAGGYTGETGSIRDYKSRLRFRDSGSTTWSDTVDTSMNSPAEHNGLWYFQAQWDAPDNRPSEGGIASAGLNYTVLGVANREGVYIQLLGCAVAVIGMIYAFYVKPVLKRRNREAVLASLAKDERKMQEVDA
ncbi:MAG: Cytochrome c biosis protein Ccs1 [Planctomycetota bacterium]|jgi:hypothetical protein